MKPEDRPGLRGLGLLALPVCGTYAAPELTKTTTLVLKEPPQYRGPWFYYSLYYTSAGMYQMGGAAWERFQPIVDGLLLSNQAADGSWPDPPGNQEGESVGRVYTTSMALLCLGIHSHYLPIYQR
jgi:hypothetical protein